MGKIMDSFPKTYQDWLTQHISDLMALTDISPASLRLKTSAHAAEKRTRTLII
jgi:hypothetical protein